MAPTTVAKRMVAVLQSTPILTRYSHDNGPFGRLEHGLPTLLPAREPRFEKAKVSPRTDRARKNNLPTHQNVEASSRDNLHEAPVALLDLRPTSPRRPPAWRWHLGKLVVAGKLVPPVWIDSKVRQAAAFCETLYRCQSDADQQCLQAAVPAMYEAHRVYEAKDGYRWELEARILARESPDTIAAKTALPLAAIDQFQQCFFDVADRLDSPSYVVQCVVGKKVHEGLKPDDLRELWAFYGYWGGPLVLDELIATFRPADKPTQPGDVQAFFHTDMVSTLRRVAAIAVRTLPIANPKVAIQLLKVYLRVKELEIKRDTRQREYADLTTHVAAFDEGIRRIFETPWPQSLLLPRGRLVAESEHEEGADSFPDLFTASAQHGALQT